MNRIHFNYGQLLAWKRKAYEKLNFLVKRKDYGVVYCLTFVSLLHIWFINKDLVTVCINFQTMFIGFCPCSELEINIYNGIELHDLDMGFMDIHWQPKVWTHSVLSSLY